MLVGGWEKFQKKRKKEETRGGEERISCKKNLRSGLSGQRKGKQKKST